MNELTPDEHNIIVDAIHDSATVIHKGQRMNERIKQLMGQTLDEKFSGTWSVMDMQDLTKFADRFAEVIVRECQKLNSKELSITAIERLLPLYREHFGVEE
jgi:hypothetical protein